MDIHLTSPHTMSVGVSDRFRSKVLPISSQAAGKMLRIDVGIEVCGPMSYGFSIKNNLYYITLRQVRV